MAERVRNTMQFIRKAREIHGTRYDYSFVQYVGSKTNVLIICPTHGVFQQRPLSHIKGYGCTKCSNEKRAAEMKRTGIKPKTSNYGKGPNPTPVLDAFLRTKF